MSRRLMTAALATLLAAPATAPVRAQDTTQPGAAEAKKGKPDLADTAALAKRERKAKEAAARFWDVATPIEAVLTTDLKKIRGDRRDGAPWRPATLSYAEPDGKQVTVPLQIRTRGVWRLRNCRFPPLRLNFADKATKGTIFEGIDRPKMVSVCADDERNERYVLQELQLYRAHNLVTSASHKVRPMRVTYAHTDGRPEMVRWAFLVEEPEAVAARLRGVVVEEKGARASDLEPRESAIMGVFQYLIGNTDFSISSLHNVELVRTAYGVHVPVAYDFDFAGAVNAWYAKPPPQIGIQRVTERVFRGECTPPEDLHAAVALVREKKDAIYALYADSIGRLLPESVTKTTLSFFDDFYAAAADSGVVHRRIVNACLGDR